MLAARSWASRGSRGHLGPALGGLRAPDLPLCGGALGNSPSGAGQPPPPNSDNLQRAILTLWRHDFLSPTLPLHPVCHPELHGCGTHGSAGVPVWPQHIRQQVSQTPGGDTGPRFRGAVAPTPARCLPSLPRTARRLCDSKTQQVQTAAGSVSGRKLATWRTRWFLFAVWSWTRS